MAVDYPKLLLSLASTLSLLYLFVCLRAVKKDIREESGPERRQHVGVFYNLFSTMIGLYALEGVFMVYSFMSDPYPEGVASKPWDACYVSGLTLVSINILLMWMNILFAVETWIIIVLASAPKHTFFLRRKVRGKVYAVVTGVASLVHVVCLGVVPGYGMSKKRTYRKICSLANEGEFRGFVYAYHILAIIQFISLAGVSVRIIWHVRRKSAKHSLYRLARKMVVLPLLLCIFDIFPNIDRFMRLVNSISFVPSDLLVFLAVVKGLFIVFGYTIQNSRVRRYFLCRSQESDEGSNMAQIQSSFSEDEDEENGVVITRVSKLSNVPYTPYRPPALVDAEGTELTTRN